MTRAHPAAAAFYALGLLAAAPPAGVVHRPIALGGPGKQAVALDAAVYDRARTDLGDLRIVDDQGSHTPYLLLRMHESPPPPREPVTLNRGFAREQSATATLDFGGPVPKAALGLLLSGDNFRRRVIVEGRHRTEDAWTTLTDGAYVFAVPSTPPARYERVDLPENDFPLLRVTVQRGPDDPPLVEIRKAWILPASSAGAREVPVPAARFSRTDEARARETVITVELGARAQPFRAVVLDVGDARFFREVAVEASRRPSGRRERRGAAPEWAPLGSAAVYRYADSSRVNEKLRVDVCGRERAIRLRVRNRDDRPLDLRGVTVLGPVERLVFEARPGRSYTLEYGVGDRLAPSYDLARTAALPAAWGDDAAPATLDSPTPAGTGSGRPPWTERHPAVLWVGLGAAVCALGALTWRALRAAG